MKKKPLPPLTKEQKEVIAGQLAEFFFGYWQNRSKVSQKKSTRNSKAIAVASGLPRSFPETTRAMA